MTDCNGFCWLAVFKRGCVCACACMFIESVKVKEGPEYYSRFTSLHKGIIFYAATDKNTFCKSDLSLYSLCSPHLLCFSKLNCLVDSTGNSAHLCPHTCDRSKQEPGLEVAVLRCSLEGVCGRSAAWHGRSLARHSLGSQGSLVHDELGLPDPGVAGPKTVARRPQQGASSSGSGPEGAWEHLVQSCRCR